MTISAPASLTKIKAEFGGPDNFSAYVRGGSYVPNISAFNAISATTSGLAISQFLNISSVIVTLPQYNSGLGYDVSLSASAIDDNPSATVWASASLILYADGTGKYRTDNYNTGVSDYNFTWLTSGSASNVYAYLDTPSGDSVTGASSAVASSLQMNTTRVWEWYAETVGYGSASKSATTTLRLKNSSGTDLSAVSVSIVLSASNGGLFP